MASRKSYLWEFGIANALKRGLFAGRRVRAANVDVVLAIGASVDIAFARFGVPVVQIVDSTFEGLLGFYPMFTGLHPASVAQARVIARVATRRTARFIGTSQWAVDSLVDGYGVQPARCVLAPLGPAIQPELVPDPVRHDGPLRILVVASNWARKRGDASVAAVGAAREQGLDATLTLVGDTPAHLPPWATALGSLPRNDLSTIYLQSDVLLDLSVATAASVVAADAAAHGLPIIALNTAGTSSVVIHGDTGILVDPSPGAAQLHSVMRALTLLSDRTVRHRMSAAALSRARHELSWSVWSSRANETLHSAVGH